LENKTRNILVFVVIVCLIGVVSTSGSWDEWIAGSGLGSQPTVKTTSTFSFYDAASGEIVSGHLHISIWKNDPDEGTLTGDDIYKLQYYEEDIKTKDAADVSIDLRDIERYFIEINPGLDQYYLHTYIPRTGGKNVDLLLPVYHRPSNVSINFRDRNTGDEWDKSSDIVGTIDLDLPWNSTNELCVGEDWSISTTEYNALSESAKLDYKDQRKYRVLAQAYDPSVDLDRDYNDNLEQLTSAPVIRYTFYNSINLTDGSANQVNITLLETNGITPPFDVQISAQYIDIIGYSPIYFNNGPYALGVKIEVGASQNCTALQIGWGTLPRETVTAFTALNSAPF